MEKNLVTIKNLSVEYKTKKGILGTPRIVHAVNDISLDIKEGEILAIAGESGCGKSTLAKTIMKLVEPSKGEILLNDKNILTLKGKEKLKEFYEQVQMIFQNPYSSLNPKMKIGQILKEPLEINTKKSKTEIEKIIEEKISIARSLVLNPKFIIADEPVSALDVSIQAQIINLLKELKDDFNLTFLFISHDLSVIKYLSDRIAIMYLGEIIEIGKTEEIFSAPKHPYTKALLSSVPELNTNEDKEKIQLQGELPSPEKLPKGCKFNTRCPFVMNKCREENPHEINFTQTHKCKCFLYN